MSKRLSLPISIVLASLGTLAVLCSAIASSIVENGEWFQRSGSLCVLFFVLLEIHEAQSKKPTPSDSVSVGSLPSLTYQQVPRVHEWFHRLAWFGIVVGTLIWGHGDLPFIPIENTG